MLRDKVVVVTGGAGLIGRQFVKGIAAQGGRGVIADISLEQAEKVCQELQSAKGSGSIEARRLDITSKTSIETLLADLMRDHGRVDALVNNAYPRNRNYGRRFFDVEYADFCENMSLHLGGYFLMSQCFAKFFLDQGHGNIVNISSIYGVMAPRFQVYDGTSMTMPVEYAVIKSGLIHLTTYMAKSFKGKNIRVNCLSPGGVLADQPKPFLDAYKSFSLNKGMLDPSDLVGSLVFLLSEQSTYINGQNIVVDDGFSL